MSTLRPCSTAARTRSRVRRGQALVPALFIMFILTALAVVIAAGAHRRAVSASGYATSAQRYYAEQGAINYALAAMDYITNHGANYGVVPPDPTVDANGWQQLGDVWVKIDAVDTGACIDVNTATAATLQLIPSLATASSASNVSPISALVDWRTAQTSANSGDQYDDYYATLQPPYTGAHAPFDAVSQLLLVEGFTPDLLYGSISGTGVQTQTEQIDVPPTQNNNSRAARTRQTMAGGGAGGAAGSSSATSSTANSAFSDIFQDSTLPLSEILAPMIRENNIAADGTTRVNINTGSATQLEAIPGMTSAVAQAIVAYRSAQSGGTGAGGTGQAGGAGGGSTVLVEGGASGGARSLRSSRASSRGMTRQAARQVPTGGGGAAGGATGSMGGGSAGGAGGTRPGGGGAGGAAGATTTFTTIADLLQVPAVTTSLMQSIADYVTVDTGTTRPDVTNVNTAPQEVLALVPGMTRTLLNEIVAFRQGGTTFQTMGDIFSLQGVTRAQLEPVIEHLSTKSSTYKIRVRVHFPGSSAVYGAEALAELTPQGPVVYQWHEVPRSPGWDTWVAPPTLTTPPTQPAQDGTS